MPELVIVPLLIRDNCPRLFLMVAPESALTMPVLLMDDVPEEGGLA